MLILKGVHKYFYAITQQHYFLFVQKYSWTLIIINKSYIIHIANSNMALSCICLNTKYDLSQHKQGILFLKPLPNQNIITYNIIILQLSCHVFHKVSTIQIFSLVLVIAYKTLRRMKKLGTQCISNNHSYLYLKSETKEEIYNCVVDPLLNQFNPLLFIISLLDQT